MVLLATAISLINSNQFLQFLTMTTVDCMGCLNNGIGLHICVYSLRVSLQYRLHERQSRYAISHGHTARRDSTQLDRYVESGGVN